MIKSHIILFCLILIVLISTLSCKGPEIVVKDETMIHQQTYETTIRALWDFKQAITSYEKDNGEYPEHLNNLTTPVQYLTVLQPDPYSVSGRQFGYFHAKNDYVIYSIGPDRVDNRGRMVYLPTSGIFGKGDIILTSHRELPKMISKK